MPRVKAKSTLRNSNGDGRKKVPQRSSPAPLIHELSTCATEADIVQVLFYGLQPNFKYDVVLLHVLEREGWYHSLPIDSGVLQNMRRRPLISSAFAEHYSTPRATVVPLDPHLMEQGTGPGADASPSSRSSFRSRTRARSSARSSTSRIATAA